MTYPGRAELTDPSVEVWLPISSRVAVTPFELNTPEHIVTDADPKYFRLINEAVYGNSTIVAAQSQALLVSLVRKDFGDVEICRNRDT
jgi:hypothetical protein